MNKKFNTIFKIIKKYIDFTLNYKNQINEYVPNTHIASIFKEILQLCEKESMYPEIYHSSSISVLNKINEYFNLELLNKNGSIEIHKIYQKLREKNDYINQTLKMSDIIIPYQYNMYHKIHNDLKSDKIQIK